MEDALRLREAVIAAVCANEPHRLASLLQQLGKLQPTEEVLIQSGIGHLVSDRHIWCLGGHVVQRRAAALHSRWRVAFRQARSAAQPPTRPGQPFRPFGGHRAKDFLSMVRCFECQIAKRLPDTSGAVCRAVAVKMVLMGFTDLIHLAGAQVEDVRDLLPSPALRAVFMTMVKYAEAKQAARQAQQLVVLSTPSSCSTSTPSCSSPGGVLGQGQRLPASAEDLASKVKSIDVDHLQTSIDKVLVQWDVPAASGTPTAIVQSLVGAQARGEPVANVLLARAAAHRLEPKRLSKAQVASALRLWHQFAVHVLDYAAAATLPPKDGSHVEAFVGVFRNPATAANYVSNIRWACLHLGLSSAWDTVTLQATVKGAKRRRVRLHGGPSGAKRLMTKSLLSSVIAAADQSGLEELPVQCLLAWHFLLRVQSECCPLEVGQPLDAESLPLGRHSAIWVDGHSKVCLKLRVRKNRPQGSFLRRPCTCHTTGRQLCVAHRLKDFLRGKAQGSRLWKSSSHHMLASIRRILGAMNIVRPEEFTLKMFRAGHATALAEEGKSIGAILQAGEWRSAAFLAYVDVDAVDACQLLDKVLDESDDE